MSQDLKLMYQKSACKNAMVVYFSLAFISFPNLWEAFEIIDSLINPVT